MAWSSAWRPRWLVPLHVSATMPDGREPLAEAARQFDYTDKTQS